MGRCTCCGSGIDCVNELYNFAIDRYKAKYYSLKKITKEDVIGFSLLNPPESQFEILSPNVLVKTSPKSFEYVKASNKDVYNYNYFKTSTGLYFNQEKGKTVSFRRFGDYADRENVDIDDALLESYPELAAFQDLTFNNQIQITRTEKISVEQRIILEFDLSDIFDFSRDLWRMANLKIGNKTGFDVSSKIPQIFGIPQGSRGTENVIQEAKIDGPFYFTGKEKPKTFEEWNEIFSSGALKFDSVLEYEKSNDPELRNIRNGLNPGRRYANYIETSNEIDLDKLASARSIAFMVNPHEIGILPAHGMDVNTDDPNSVQRNDQPRNYYYVTGEWATTGLNVSVFEFLRPGLRDDLSEDLESFLNYGGFPSKATLLAARTEIPYYFWQDDWIRVDDMWTFVSKGSHSEYSISIIGSFFYDLIKGYYDTPIPENATLDLKLFKEKSGEKKSQIEKLYFDSIFYLRFQEEYYVAAAADIDLTGCEVGFYNRTPDPSLDIVNEFYIDEYRHQLGYEKSLPRKYYIYKDKSQYDPATSNKNTRQRYIDFTDFIENKTYYGHRGLGLGLTDNLLVSNCYIEATDVTNFKEQAYYRSTNGWSSFGPGDFRAMFGSYETTLHDVLKKHLSDVPDQIENGPAIFKKEIEPHKIKFSMKNTERKFMAYPVTIEGIAPQCNNGECVGTALTPLWEIKKQNMSGSLELLPLKYTSRDSCANFFNSNLEMARYEFKTPSRSEITSYSREFKPKYETLYFPSLQLLNPPPPRQDGFNSTTSYLTGAGDNGRGSWNGGEGAGWSNDCGPDIGMGPNMPQAGYFRASAAGTEGKGGFNGFCLNASYARYKQLAEKTAESTKEAGWTKKISIVSHSIGGRDSNFSNIGYFPAVDVGDINGGRLLSANSSNYTYKFIFNQRLLYADESQVVADRYFSRKDTDFCLAYIPAALVSVIGEGLRFRHNAKDYTTRCIGQEFEADYQERLLPHEISYISSCVNQFDGKYWYRCFGTYFFPDKNGTSSLNGVAGYYKSNPWFYIDRTDEHGPFDESGFVPYPEEYVIEVETSIEIPYNLTTLIFTDDFDKGYELGSYEGVFAAMDMTNRFDPIGKFICGLFENECRLAYSAEEYLPIYTMAYVEKYLEIPKFGWAIDNAVDNHVGSYPVLGGLTGTSLTHSPGFRRVLSNDETEGGYVSPSEIVETSHTITIPPGCDCLKEPTQCYYGLTLPTSYSATGLDCPAFGCVTMDGTTVEISSFSLEPQGDAVDYEWTGQEIKGGAKAADGNIYFSFGPTATIKLYHRKVVAGSILSPCLDLPELSFDSSDKADYDFTDPVYRYIKETYDTDPFGQPLELATRIIVGEGNKNPGHYFDVVHVSPEKRDCSSPVSNGITSCRGTWPQALPAHSKMLVDTTLVEAWNRFDVRDVEIGEIVMAGVDDNFWINNCGDRLPRQLLYAFDGGFNDYGCCNPNTFWVYEQCNDGWNASGGISHSVLDEGETCPERTPGCPAPTDVVQKMTKYTVKCESRNLYDDYTFTIGQKKI